MTSETSHPMQLTSQNPTPTDAPVFRIRISPGTPRPTPEVPPHCEPEVTEAILGAMDRLEDLLGVRGAPIQWAPVPRPQAPTELPPPVPELDLPATGDTRGKLRLPWILPVLAAGLSLGALQAKAVSRVRPEPRAFAAYPTPPLAPGLEPFRLRAEAGDPVAMRMLAFCFQEGVDTPRNPAEAARWELRAALAMP